MPQRWTYYAFKRGLDIVGSAAGLLLFSPILAAVAAAIRLTMGSPVSFRHVRPGYKALPFTLIKFRTMTGVRGGDGHLLSDEQRLTRLGSWLRRLSLDELPEFWNVLNGEMSLVGPRPLLIQYLDRYTPEQARRHDVKPGITGWAQINGRNALSWDQKFQFDLWYIDHQSLWLDLRILARTVINLCRPSGISQGGHSTMPEYSGASHKEVRRTEGT